MKRITAVLLTMLCVLVFAACSSGDGSKDTDTAQPCFTGTVLEKYEKSCLLEVTDRGNQSLTVGALVTVNTDIENCPEYSVGDHLTITFDGMIAESYPMQIHRVYSVVITDSPENSME